MNSNHRISEVLQGCNCMMKISMCIIWYITVWLCACQHITIMRAPAVVIWNFNISILWVQWTWLSPTSCYFIKHHDCMCLIRDASNIWQLYCLCSLVKSHELTKAYSILVCSMKLLFCSVAVVIDILHYFGHSDNMNLSPFLWLFVKVNSLYIGWS